MSCRAGVAPGGGGSPSTAGAAGSEARAAVELELRRVAEGEIAQRRDRADEFARQRQQVEAALELEVRLTRGRVEIPARREGAVRVGEFRLLEMERARGVVELHAQAFEPVGAAPQRVALELRGGAQVPRDARGRPGTGFPGAAACRRSGSFRFRR